MALANLSSWMRENPRQAGRLWAFCVRIGLESTRQSCLYARFVPGWGLNMKAVAGGGQG